MTAKRLESGPHQMLSSPAMTKPNCVPGFVVNDDPPPPSKPTRIPKPDVVSPTTKPYPGLPGFDPGEPLPPADPAPDRSLIDNHELVSDLARFAEGQALCTESAIRKKWRLSEETWELLGSSDELVRAVEDEKTRRIRSGATKRELAQSHIIRGPAVLATIMDDAKANARHRVDCIKALNAIADPGPEAAADQERVIIKINLGSDTRAKGQEPDPADVITIEATPRPGTPKRIEADHSEPSDEWRR